MLAREESLYGETHPETPQTLKTLGEALRAQGEATDDHDKYAAPADAFRRSYKGLAMIFGHDQSETLSAANALGNVLALDERR